MTEGLLAGLAWAAVAVGLAVLVGKAIKAGREGVSTGSPPPEELAPLLGVVHPREPVL